MKKKYIIVFSFIAFVFVLLVVSINLIPKEVENPIKENPPVSGYEDEKDHFSPYTSNILTVTFIGDLELSLPNTKIKHVEWFDEVSDTHYVIVSAVEKLNKEKIAYINQLIEDHWTVLFYGENVKPEFLQTVFDTDLSFQSVIPAIPGVDIQFPLFGFGYSFDDKRKMPLFCGTTKDNKGLSEDLYSCLADYTHINSK